MHSTFDSAFDLNSCAKVDRVAHRYRYTTALHNICVSHLQAPQPIAQLSKIIWIPGLTHLV